MGGGSFGSIVSLLGYETIHAWCDGFLLVSTVYAVRRAQLPQMNAESNSDPFLFPYFSTSAGLVALADLIQLIHRLGGFLAHMHRISCLASGVLLQPESCPAFSP